MYDIITPLKTGRVRLAGTLVSFASNPHLHNNSNTPVARNLVDPLRLFRRGSQRLPHCLISVSVHFDSNAMAFSSGDYLYCNHSTRRHRFCSESTSAKHYGSFHCCPTCEMRGKKIPKKSGVGQFIPLPLSLHTTASPKGSFTTKTRWQSPQPFRGRTPLNRPNHTDLSAGRPLYLRNPYHNG